MSSRICSGRPIRLALLWTMAGALLLHYPAHARLSLSEEADRIAAARERIVSEGLSWSAGRTSVSHLDVDEMTTRLGLNAPESNPTPEVSAPPGCFPLRWDWRELDGVTAVRDQGDCGCCWAFAATAAFEAAIRIHTGEAHDLSEQHVILCNNLGHGCTGGWMTTAYDLFIRAGGVLEVCVPYEAQDTGPCTSGDCAAVAHLTHYCEIGGTVRSLKAALLDGPVSLAMTVHEDFLCYSGGCYEHAASGAPNHAVLLIGWDDAGCDGAGAWIAKNSWGSDWGEQGFFHIKYNTCEFGYGAHQIEYHPADGITIEHAPLDDPVAGEAGYAVQTFIASADEDLAVELHYAINGGAPSSLPMVPTGVGGEYRGAIPSQDGGTVVDYYLAAEDGHGQRVTAPLRAPARLYRFRTGCQIICRYDFEGEPSGWEHRSLTGAGRDEWHLNDYANHTPEGRWSFKCGGPAGEDYDDLLDVGLTTPPIDLPIEAELRFHHRIDAERSAFHMGWAYDGGIVEISADGGTTWTYLSPMDGYPYLTREGATPGPFPAGMAIFSGDEPWREERFDLSAHRGTVHLRFRFGSDGALTRDGWWIDDLLVVGYPPGRPQSSMQLLSAAASLRGPEVTVRWRPAEPVEFIGFHLERGLAQAGPFERRTGEMIPSDWGGELIFRESLTDLEPISGAPGTGAGLFYRILGIRRGGGQTKILQVIQAHWGAVDSEVVLLPNLPNPFRDGTELRFRLPAGDARAQVALAVYDAQGRMIARPSVASGECRAFWDGCDAGGNRVSAGQYYVRLRVKGRVLYRRMVRLP